MIGEIRGRGLLLASSSSPIAGPARPLSDRSALPARGRGHARAQRHQSRAGLVSGDGRLGGDQIQISPPFTISESEIGILVGSLDEVLSEIEHSLGPKAGADRGSSSNRS